jgi:hypothetical protein
MIGGSNAKRLAKALDELGGAKQPTQRLAAARRAREAADRLERAHVDAAREAGMTWAEIGAIYGLTKQGAQQRFRAGRPKSKER